MKELTFGQRITEFRKKINLKQKELAQKADITPTALNYYEKDKREPNVNTIKKLIIALGVTGDELLGTSEYERDFYTKEEMLLIYDYRSLDVFGQKKVIDYVDDLVESGKYKKSNSVSLRKEA